MYRTATEGILGITLRGNALTINPCIPRNWPGFEITYRHGSSVYRITVDNARGVCRGITRASLDGRDFALSDGVIHLVDDGAEHHAQITLG
jgi:cyclic beta-1,2-glucan synthetase